jgi:hypothetical protein
MHCAYLSRRQHRLPASSHHPPGRRRCARRDICVRKRTSMRGGMGSTPKRLAPIGVYRPSRDRPRRGLLGAVTLWAPAETRFTCGLWPLVCVPPSMVCCSLPSTVPLFSPLAPLGEPSGENENRYLRVCQAHAAEQAANPLRKPHHAGFHEAPRVLHEITRGASAHPIGCRLRQ